MALIPRYNIFIHNYNHPNLRVNNTNLSAMPNNNIHNNAFLALNDWKGKVPHPNNTDIIHHTAVPASTRLPTAIARQLHTFHLHALSKHPQKKYYCCLRSIKKHGLRSRFMLQTTERLLLLYY